MVAKARKSKAKKTTTASKAKAKKTAKTTTKAKSKPTKKVTIKKAIPKKVVAKPKAKVTSKTKPKAATKKLPSKTTAKTKNKPKSLTKSKKSVVVKKDFDLQAEVSGNLIRHKFHPYIPKTNEEYMNDSQLEHFKLILDDWKNELMEEVDETIKELKEAGVRRVPADPNDRASQEENFTVELRTRDRERKLIKKIEDALSMIDDKDYGYCESCGEEIGLRRLEARPTAFLCIDCKTLDEIREKRNS